MTAQYDIHGRELRIGDAVEVITTDFAPSERGHQIGQGTVGTLVDFDAYTEMFEVEYGSFGAAFKASELRRLDQR